MPERQSTDDDNPFAPPPEGQPDQPWQPRRPEGSDDDSSSDSSSGSSRGRWSSRQPGRSSDGFGRRPERQGGPEQGQKPGPKWDPTDPAQRRARYALLAGMWAFFFAIFEIQELALLLGALALYWAVSALRTKPKAVTATGPSASATAPAPTPADAAFAAAAAAAAAAPARAQRTAAVSGLVAAALALLIVAGSFTMQLVYRDFYTCADDALTHSGQLACNDLLPEPLRDVFGVRE
ncbi:hypothetical protein J7E93_29690 [Streptomyces sp. ISL-36]|uniref:hypothetical protein n=1 Tax=Streptomyces sp. ISL-36 TaxID=2819182 RepID=UPI001BE77F67|nr:hypothetical protein [Streptomyces sp. ISL-36]MBT2444191.1 hypothetical protein [Streptomyces sp. ISL-36]